MQPLVTATATPCPSVACRLCYADERDSLGGMLQVTCGCAGTMLHTCNECLAKEACSNRDAIGRVPICSVCRRPMPGLAIEPEELPALYRMYNTLVGILGPNGPVRPRANSMCEFVSFALCSCIGFMASLVAPSIRTDHLIMFSIAAFAALIITFDRFEDARRIHPKARIVPVAIRS